MVVGCDWVLHCYTDPVDTGRQSGQQVYTVQLRVVQSCAVSPVQRTRPAMSTERKRSAAEAAGLTPLPAQVGGHYAMKILDEQYVCKPWNRRELQFYQRLPKQLRNLVPTFYGCLSLDDGFGKEMFARSR